MRAGVFFARSWPELTEDERNLIESTDAVRRDGCHKPAGKWPQNPEFDGPTVTNETVTQCNAPVTRRYVYLGDRLTSPALIGARCVAVLRPDGKCIRGRGTMLVVFVGEADSRAVLARRLRRVTS